MYCMHIACKKRAAVKKQKGKVGLTRVFDLDVLYAIHQLTITFVTYIFKITSLTSLFFRRARKNSFCFKKTGHVT